MNNDIKKLVSKLTGSLQDNAYKTSDALARIGTREVLDAMIELLQNPNPESRIMAARTLGKMENNNEALPPLLDAIKSKDNADIAGELMVALEEFDVSDSYVDLFRLFLFGNFKVSSIAKELLDYKEFNITPRVLRKAEKHWNHYMNNAKHDEAFAIMEKEVKEMLASLKNFLED